MDVSVGFLMVLQLREVMVGLLTIQPLYLVKEDLLCQLTEVQYLQAMEDVERYPWIESADLA